jgi:N-acyl-L-homoserine lactone synthetase
VVKLVTHANKDRFAPLLDGMFRDRKRVFVDRLKWDVPVVDGIYEMDQYDTQDTVYLIVDDPKTGAHRGSVRLLPTTGPHMLKEIFPELCEGEVPIGPDVWEATRICTAPDLKDIDPRHVRRLIYIATFEFALLYGVSRVTILTHMDYLSRLLAFGWECRPLGLPREYSGQKLGAMEFGITPTSLQAMRAMFHNGDRTPVLEIEGITKAA